MGYGVPASIGAQVGAPGKIVVNVDGDASFSMTAMEMATAAQYKIPVKILILNNEFQGMVLQWQDLFYMKRYSHTEMTNPDFVKLAEAFGVKGIRCSSLTDLPAAMDEFMSCKEPVIFDARIVKTEHGAYILLACERRANLKVYPMVAAGKALHEMALVPEQAAKAVGSFSGPLN